MIGEFARSLGFWTIDAIHGGEIRKHYLDIKSRIENQQTNDEQLEILLNHAALNVPFYSQVNAKKLESFPIIDKNTIKGNWNDLHANNYKDKPVHLMSTSGSTGTPFTMEWDMGKRKRQLAELIYFNEQGGQYLGQRYVYFRVWTKRNQKSRKEQFIQNLVPIDILHLDDENLEAIRNRLKSKPIINSCLAYASTYEHLARYVRTKGDTREMFPIKTFFSGSEVLSMASKQLIKDTFGCKVIDRYSNEENGFLGQTNDMSDEFRMNIASFKIEILKQDCDEPAEIGEVGRIVVTDLFSLAVPLIRYDTGDLAILGASSNGWATMLKTIQGRQVDTIYDTCGKRMTSHTLSVYMWKYEKLKQYQFIQEDEKSYTIKLNGAKGNYSDEEIKTYLKSILGIDAVIQIEHVEGIPVLASGKFKKTVCNYKKG